MWREATMIWFNYQCIVKEVGLTKHNQPNLIHMLQNLQEPTNLSRRPKLEATQHLIDLEPQSLPWHGNAYNWGPPFTHTTRAFMPLRYFSASSELVTLDFATLSGPWLRPLCNTPWNFHKCKVTSKKWYKWKYLNEDLTQPLLSMKNISLNISQICILQAITTYLSIGLSYLSESC